MKIASQQLEDHQVRLTVEIEPDQFEEAKRKAARKLAKRIKIPGFRPGKAPYSVIARHVGEEALIEEGVELLVDDLYPRLIEEAEIKPYGPGRLENISNFDPLTMEFIVPLRAEITLGDYRSIRLPYEQPTVTEEEIEAVLENLRQRHSIEETVDRPAEEGDRVYFQISAKRYDPELGEEAPLLLEERPYTAIITGTDEDTHDEWPFDGFSRELIGSTTGSRKTIIYTFPEDSEFENLRSETAEFNVIITDVKSRTLPELNDEFAQTLGEYQDLESLRKEIRDTLTKRVVNEYDSDYDDRVLDEVISKSEIKYPPQMVENEIDEVIHQLERRLMSQGLDLETYLKAREMDLEGLRAEARPVAETRIKRSLVLFKIAETESIDVSEGELQEEADRTINNLTQIIAEPQRRKMFSPQAVTDLIGNIYTEMRIDRTLNHLRKIAKGELDSDMESSSEETREQETDDGETAQGKT